MKHIKLVVILLLSSFSLLTAAQNQPAKTSTENDKVGVLSWLYDRTNDGVSFLQNKKDFLDLAEALMHIPYVASINSTDPKTIKVATTLAGVATSIKLVSILGIPQNMPPVKIIIWDIPKVLCYVAAGLYDIIRVGDAEMIAEKNASNPVRLKSFKITQMIQLTIEIVLRTLAIVSSYGNDAHPNNALMIRTVTAELADIVGMWRLLGRYTTYFMYIDEFAINLVIKKKLNDDGEQELPQETLAEAEKQETDNVTTPSQDSPVNNIIQSETQPIIQSDTQSIAQSTESPIIATT